MDLSRLTTEARNERTMNLDTMSVHEFVTVMNQEDQGVALSISKSLPQIEQAIVAITAHFKKGGRLFYMGAGTSGRLGVLDAAECVPTFGTEPDMVQGLIAGGMGAMTLAVEGAEDSAELGASDLRDHRLTAQDVVVGIAASGRTPYVIGGLDYARSVGAATIALACNAPARISAYADVAIEVPVGPEVFTGSTRLKAGTAQKLVLNMLSTGAMIGIGKVYKNLMVDVRSTNAKLIERAKRMISQATGCDEATAAGNFETADHDVKLAIVMTLTGLQKADAQRRLERAGGFIVNAIKDDATKSTRYDFSELDADMHALIAGGQTGSSVLVVKDGAIVHNGNYGYRVKFAQGNDVFNDHRSVSLDSSRWLPVDDDTMWDMASVTKMLATNLALQKLVDENKLDITKKVGDYISGFHDYPEVTAALTPQARVKQHKDRITVEMLLRHEAGQLPDPGYFNDNYLNSQVAAHDMGFSKAGSAYEYLYVPPQSNTADRAKVLDAIGRTPLANAPGTTVVYSDVDYMLLGLIVERVTGMPLDTYVESAIYRPLGLTHTMFNPLRKGFDRDEFAATEINGNTRDGYRTPTGAHGNAFSFTGMRTYTLRGQAHDEKAYYTMAGVSGHAGLFSTSHDVAVLMQLMLNNGTYQGVKLFDKATVDEFLTPGSLVLGNGYTRTDYALGWYVNDAYYPGASTGWPDYFSHYASMRTFGHQGWTGPLVYADPVHKLIVVYMRNRPHNPVVGPQNVNSFVGSGTNATTYLTVANDVYRSIGATTYVSFLPDIGPQLQVIANDFARNPTVKVDVTFTDPLSHRSITKMFGRNPRVTRVNVADPEPNLPRSVIEPSGSTALIEPADWLAQGAAYHFNATQPGDYYVSLYSAANTGMRDVKMKRYVRIVDAVPRPHMKPFASVPN